MEKIIGLMLLNFTFSTAAGEYNTPACYESVPTACGFDEMTLSLCNQEGKISGAKFSLAGRSYLPGGNKFMSGSKHCLVKKIKGTEPAKYNVQVK